MLSSHKAFPIPSTSTAVLSPVIFRHRRQRYDPFLLCSRGFQHLPLSPIHPIEPRNKSKPVMELKQKPHAGGHSDDCHGQHRRPAILSRDERAGDGQPEAEPKRFPYHGRPRAMHSNLFPWAYAPLCTPPWRAWKSSSGMGLNVHGEGWRDRNGNKMEKREQCVININVLRDDYITKVPYV